MTEPARAWPVAADHAPDEQCAWYWPEMAAVGARVGVVAQQDHALGAHLGDTLHQRSRAHAGVGGQDDGAAPHLRRTIDDYPVARTKRGRHALPRDFVGHETATCQRDQNCGSQDRAGGEGASIQPAR